MPWELEWSERWSEKPEDNGSIPFCGTICVVSNSHLGLQRNWKKLKQGWIRL